MEIIPKQKEICEVQITLTPLEIEEMIDTNTREKISYRIASQLIKMFSKR